MLECDYFDRDSTRNGSCQSAISKWTGDISPDGKDEEIVKNSSSGMMLTSVMPGGKHHQPGRESWAQSGISPLSLETEFPGLSLAGDGM